MRVSIGLSSTVGVAALILSASPPPQRQRWI